MQTDAEFTDSFCARTKTKIQLTSNPFVIELPVCDVINVRVTVGISCARRLNWNFS